MGFPTYEEIIELKNAGTKNIWVHLSQKYNEDKETLRGWFRREAEKRVKEADDVLVEDYVENKNTVSETYGFDSQGNIKTISSVKTIEMSKEQKEDPEFVLKAHGYNPEKWMISSLANSYKDVEKDGVLSLYTSKITVKAKNNYEINISDINRFFENFKSENVSVNRTEKNRENFYGKTLLINLADAHFGNNIENFSAREIIIRLVEKVRNKILFSKQDFSKIYFINLGDILHIDNYQGQTTSGTQVGERGSFYSIWEDALKTMIDSIDILSEVCPVEFISICGNHDKISSFTIAKALEYYYKENDNVLIDSDFKHRKYRVIGNSLFGFVHGDLPSKNVPSVLQREAREDFGKTKYSYVLLGHIHHTNIVDVDGVIVSHLPSITPPDEWHKGEGYTGAWRGTNCYVVDDNFGIEETWHIGEN